VRALTNGILWNNLTIQELWLCKQATSKLMEEKAHAGPLARKYWERHFKQWTSLGKPGWWNNVSRKVDVAKESAVAASNLVERMMGKQLFDIILSRNLMIAIPLARESVGAVGAIGHSRLLREIAMRL
jgi:hypothetical protein